MLQSAAFIVQRSQAECCTTARRPLAAPRPPWTSSRVRHGRDSDAEWKISARGPGLRHHVNLKPTPWPPAGRAGSLRRGYTHTRGDGQPNPADCIPYLVSPRRAASRLSRPRQATRPLSRDPQVITTSTRCCTEVTRPAPCLSSYVPRPYCLRMAPQTSANRPGREYPWPGFQFLDQCISSLADSAPSLLADGNPAVVAPVARKIKSLWDLVPYTCVGRHPATEEPSVPSVTTPSSLHRSIAVLRRRSSLPGAQRHCAQLSRLPGPAQARIVLQDFFHRLYNSARSCSLIT